MRLVLVAYLAFCLLLTVLETSLIYLPPPVRDAQRAGQQLGGEEVWFHADDGVKLHGWFFPHQNTDRALIYLHGNGEDADQNVDLGAYLRDCLRAAVLVFDYRGYGHSEGAPFEAGIILDAVAAQQWLGKKIQIDPEEMILFGRSLGGAVAVAAAEQLGAKALILYGTFANLDDIAARHYPLVPVRLLMRNRYRSEERLQSFTGPVLQFHGTADELIPIDLARPLLESSISKQKRFIELTNGQHNDPLPDNFCEVVDEFLLEIAKP